MKTIDGNDRSYLRNLLRACALLLVLVTALVLRAPAQAPTTTTVTGTVYLANGQPGAGTLVVSWPAFTTAAGQLVAADSLTVSIPSDGFVSVNLAPNQGATPAGEYYTAVFYMSDGSTSTQYWIVPAASSATLAAVQSQVMPSAQAVQTVSKAYVDQAISELSTGGITSTGGTLTGPLYLNGDPTQPLQAADKHYVDNEVAAGGGGSGTVNSGATSQIAYYTASGTAVAGSAATVSSNGAGAFAGLDDTVGSNLPSYLESGSDEGTRLQSAINALITAPGAGRAISESVPTRQTAVTWAVNPFASLLNSNGSVNNSNVYQLTTQVQPWQQVTTQAEIDLGQYAQLDCGDVYGIFSAYSSTNVGGVIQPANSGYPTTTLITDGPSTAATGTTLVTQGDKITNCALYSNGVTGMTAINSSWGQEGTQMRNLRLNGFMVGINRDNTATSGGIQNNFGIYDTQVEMTDNTDSTVWGLRYGFNSPTAMSGMVENAEAIGSQNPNGVTKIGLEDDGSDLHVLDWRNESLTYGLLFNNLHSGQKFGGDYNGDHCNAANAPTFACAMDAGAGQASYHIANVRNTGAPVSNTFIDKEEPSATIESLSGDFALGAYDRITPPTGNHAEPVIKTTSPQAGDANHPAGDAFENEAAWPTLLLPGKTIQMTENSVTYTGTACMSASDKSGGVIPYGIALNGDLAATTSSTVHMVTLVRQGLSPIIFDGATTAGDFVVLSSAAVEGSCVGAHDSGSGNAPSSSVYLGIVRRSAATVTAPSAPVVTTNCTVSCTTTYTYQIVQRNSADPFDLTQSAPSTTTSVSGPVALTTNTYNTITPATGCTSTAPCDVYRTSGGLTGFILEIRSSAAFKDQGLIGNGKVAFSGGIIAPPVDLLVGNASTASLASSSAPGLAQCDGVTITCSGSGVLSTAAGTPLTHWSVAGGMMTTSASAAFAATANAQAAQDVELPAQVNFNQMCVNITTADVTGGDLYNLALVKLTTPGCTGSSCASTTVASWTAAQALSSTGTKCVANAQGNVALAPGDYYLVTTGNAATAKMAATSSSGQKWTALSSASAGTGSGGTFGTITLNVLASGATQISGAPVQIALTLTQ